MVISEKLDILIIGTKITQRKVHRLIERLKTLKVKFFSKFDS